MGHDDRGAHLEHRQVAAPERRAGIGWRHERTHAGHERLGGLSCGLRVVRIQGVVDRDDELGERPQPLQPEALRGDLQELGVGEPAAVALEVDPLGCEQLPVQVEQVRTQCGKVIGDAVL